MRENRIGQERPGKIIEGKIMILSPMILPLSVSFVHSVHFVVGDIRHAIQS
jgi:hypothetical protein